MCEDVKVVDVPPEVACCVATAGIDAWEVVCVAVVVADVGDVAGDELEPGDIDGDDVEDDGRFVKLVGEGATKSVVKCIVTKDV